MLLWDYFFIFGAKYLFLVALAIALFTFLKAERSLQKKLLLLMVVSFPLVFIVARITSGFYFNPRPFVVGDFIPLVAHEPDNGFPSDHLLLLSSVSVLFFLFKRQIAYWLIIISVVVAISRVYVGVHHTLDVVGSAVISTLVILLINKMLNNFSWYRNI